jgi:uncharacterized protein YuzE
MVTPDAQETSNVYCRITKNDVARRQHLLDGRLIVDWDAEGEIVGVEITDTKVPGGPWIVTRAGMK